MTAPGANLDFYESSAFVARVTDHEEVRAAIQRHLRNNPRAGKAVCGPLYTLELAVEGREVVYIYGRKEQRVNIAYVFEIPSEDVAFKARLEDMKKRYCVGAERRKP